MIILKKTVNTSVLADLASQVLVPELGFDLKAPFYSIYNDVSDLLYFFHFHPSSVHPALGHLQAHTTWAVWSAEWCRIGG
jgi:hypothetical protein